MSFADSYEWGLLHERMGFVTYMNASWHTYNWVAMRVWMSHVTQWMGHATHMNKSCHTYGWVMPHIWMSHATHMNESCHTYEWVMSHVWMSHVAHLSESCHTYGWVMPHIWMSRVTYMSESCHTYEWVMCVTELAPDAAALHRLAQLLICSDVHELYMLWRPRTLNESCVWQN